MPSFGTQGSVTSALQSITGSTLASTTLKTILENPMKFEKAPESTSTGLSGKYIPLNKPVNLTNGTGNGVRNGVEHTLTAASTTSSSEESEEEEDVHLVNGGSASVEMPKDGILTEWPKPLKRPPGLTNFSNTCYMNSTLQALMHIPPLVTYFLTEKHSSMCSKGIRSCTFCRLERLTRESYPADGIRSNHLEPYGIVGKAGVLGKFTSVHRQEDAHELFLHILDKMDEAEKKTHRDPKFKTIIQKIFGGECRQTITCDIDGCGNVSHTSQDFLDLSIDLLIRGRDIMSSLQDFTGPETLSKDNLYTCEKCKEKSRAKKRTKIHRAPPILAIHLKRFSPSGIRKNSTLIHYPEELDLDPYMSEESQGGPKYRLIATVCHHSFGYGGMNSGHYTAKCKSSSGTWNEFDDTTVSMVPFHEVLKDSSAYILIYARDDPSRRRAKLSQSVGSALSTPTTTKQLNGVNKVNGSSVSPGQKRLLDEETPSDESPPKRLRLSDDEDHHQSHKPLPREPLKSVINGNMDSQVPMIRPTFTKPSPTYTNGHAQPPLESLTRSANRPYSPKQIPREIGGSKKFFDTVHNLSQTKSKPPEARIGAPKHRIKALETTTTNVYARSNDPFVEGVLKGQNRKSQARPAYPGISSAIVPGANREFNRDSGMKSGITNKRDMLGVKVRRKDAMK